MSSRPFSCDQKKVPAVPFLSLHRARQRALPVHVLRQHVAAELADVHEACCLGPREYAPAGFRENLSNDQAAVLGHEASGAVIETRRVEIHHAAGLGPHERVFTSIRGGRIADHQALLLTPCGTV